MPLTNQRIGLGFAAAFRRGVERIGGKIVQRGGEAFSQCITRFGMGHFQQYILMVALKGCVGLLAKASFLPSVIAKYCTNHCYTKKKQTQLKIAHAPLPNRGNN